MDNVKVSHVRPLATPWTIACQTTPSMGFSKQEYWNGLPFPSPGHLPTPGIELGSPSLQADSLPAEPPVYDLSYLLFHYFAVQSLGYF